MGHFEALSKNKGEKKNENFTNRSSPATNKQQAQSSSSPACLHSDYVLLFVAVLQRGREENRFMIVNFPPMCFASALMVFFGCLHRCDFPSDFPSLPSISLAFPARSTRTCNYRLIINPPFVCCAQYFPSPRMIYGFLINFIELFLSLPFHRITHVADDSPSRAK